MVFAKELAPLKDQCLVKTQQEKKLSDCNKESWEPWKERVTNKKDINDTKDSEHNFWKTHMEFLIHLLGR